MLDNEHLVCTAIARRLVPTVLVAALISIAAGCARSAPPAPSQSFGLDNLTNATPSLASRGDLVVLSWTTSELDGSQANVFAAVSEDAGRTFRAPVRVNDRVGTARNSGEQAPRIAIGQDVIALVWSARHDGQSEIVFSRSTDGGRTFSAARAAHPAGLTGLRGWASAAYDRDNRLHVLWLDGRNAPPAAPHVHGAHAMPSASEGGAPIQDLFHAVVDGSIAVDRLAVQNVCFCCKTSVTPRPDGSVVALWRHIFPESTRDIGATILGASSPTATVTRVGEDNWQIAACPDDGPAAVVAEDGSMHAVWPTAVSNRAKGIFYASATDAITYGERQRVDGGEAAGASHPQIALLDSKTIAVVWDEALGDENRVMVRRRDIDSGTWSAAEALPDSQDGIYPVAAAADGAMLVAWTNRGTTPSKIALARLPAR